MSKDRMFFAVLALVTAIPLLAIPAAALWPGGPATSAVMPLAAAAWIASTPHVASTAFFYVDREYHPLIRANLPRFLLTLVLIPAAMVGLVFIGKQAILWSFACYTGWLLWHFQKQNYGLLSLAMKSVGAGSVPKMLKVGLDLAAIAGIAATLGMLSFYPEQFGAAGFVLARIHEPARLVGIALYGVSLICVARALFLNPEICRSSRCLFLTIAASAFFVPAFLTDNPFVAVSAYGTAHGLQYLLMNATLSKKSSEGWVGLACMVVIAASGAMVLNLLWAGPIWMAQIAVGLTMFHFVADAKIWRMREPMQRDLIRTRFGFLFAAPRGAAKAHAAGSAAPVPL
jgi:hypothetical protein